MAMDVFECISARRSVREYETRQVPRDVVEKILNAAARAPSARHVLPWKFIIIENREKLKDLDSSIKKAYGLMAKVIGVARVLRPERFQNVMKTVIEGDPALSYRVTDRETGSYVDVQVIGHRPIEVRMTPSDASISHDALERLREDLVVSIELFEERVRSTSARLGIWLRCGEVRLPVQC
jgi:nitroreductase